MDSRGDVEHAGLEPLLQREVHRWNVKEICENSVEDLRDDCLRPYSKEIWSFLGLLVAAWLLAKMGLFGWIVICLLACLAIALPLWWLVIKLHLLLADKSAQNFLTRCIHQDYVEKAKQLIQECSNFLKPAFQHWQELRDSLFSDRKMGVGVKWGVPMLITAFCLFLSMWWLHVATYYYLKYFHDRLKAPLELGPASPAASDALRGFSPGANISAVSYGANVDVPESFTKYVDVDIGVLDLIAGGLPFIFAVVTWHVRDLQLWTKAMTCHALLAFYKGLIGFLTIVPDSRGWEGCLKGLGPENAKYLLEEISDPFVYGPWWTLFDLLHVELDGPQHNRLGSGLRWCADMMYSGHTYTTFLYALALLEWLKRHMAIKPHERPFMSMQAFCHYVAYYGSAAFVAGEQMVEVYLVISNRFHYTSDVIMGMLITMLWYTSGPVIIYAKWWSSSFGSFYGMTNEGSLWVPPLCLPFCCFGGMSGNHRLKWEDSEEALKDDLLGELFGLRVLFNAATLEKYRNKIENDKMLGSKEPFEGLIIDMKLHDHAQDKAAKVPYAKGVPYALMHVHSLRVLMVGPKREKPLQERRSFMRRSFSFHPDERLWLGHLAWVDYTSIVQGGSPETPATKDDLRSARDFTDRALQLLNTQSYLPPEEDQLRIKLDQRRRHISFLISDAAGEPAPPPPPLSWEVSAPRRPEVYEKQARALKSAIDGLSEAGGLAMLVTQLSEAREKCMEKACQAGAHERPPLQEAIEDPAAARAALAHDHRLHLYTQRPPGQEHSGLEASVGTAPLVAGPARSPYGGGAEHGGERHPHASATSHHGGVVHGRPGTPPYQRPDHGGRTTPPFPRPAR